MTAILSLKAKQSIDKWLTKYPSHQKQSAVLHALTVVQEENKGWLSESLMDAVAAYLEMPKIAVYEVASFYSLFEVFIDAKDHPAKSVKQQATQKPGKHKISVCTNISCYLNGSEEIVRCLKSRLKIDFGQTTQDGLFSLREVECLAACGGAPAMQIGKQYYENLTTDKIKLILADLEHQDE